QDPESMEFGRQPCRHDLVDAKLDASGIAAPATVEPGDQQHVPDHGMNRVPILQMEEVHTLPEHLGFVVFLDTETLPGMNPAQAFFQPLDDVDHRVSHDWVSRCTSRFARITASAAGERSPLFGLGGITGVPSCSSISSLIQSAS